MNKDELDPPERLLGDLQSPEDELPSINTPFKKTLQNQNQICTSYVRTENAALCCVVLLTWSKTARQQRGENGISPLGWNSTQAHVLQGV